ncbi:MAG: hypothetical protein IT385_02950 [Deltaproteobacteria bacterium]|nr:hypothetical protein [Deltaproteobacteria bacterium]
MTTRRSSLSTALVLLPALAACDEPGGRGGQTPLDAADATTTTDATTSTTTTDASTTTTTDVATTTTSDTSVGPDTSTGAPLLVDPRCTDGQYDEALPDDGADISGLVAGYQASGYLDFVDDVLGARYPIGQHLVREGVRLGTGFGNCIDLFTHDTSSASAIFGSLSTVVHECGHIADLSAAGFSTSVFMIRDDLELECPNAAARAGKTFARSRLNGDAYAALLPDDFYRDTYLDGDPDNSTFEGGDQGYDSLLEEATQYVNSLATDWAFADQSRFSVSARDGILTFLWYLERYLRMARLEYPSAYQVIAGNACWRDATLTVWGRAWLYLDLTEGDRSLGINDDAIEPLVKDPELVGEIARLRTASGCP